jgi:hypothetical protein
MEYILAYQTPYDTVTYITDDLLTVDYLSYGDFLKFIKPFIKKDFAGFVENLNRFYNVFVNTNEKTWKVYHNKFDVPTMQQLIELNETKDKKRFWNRKDKTRTTKVKDYLSDIIDNKYHRQEIIQTQFYKDLPRQNLGKLKILEK